MKFSVNERRRGKSQGRKRSNQPPGPPAKSPTCSSPSSRRPAAGKGAGGAPAAKYQLEDYAVSEEEFESQMRLALAISASEPDSRGDGPENGQIRAATRLGSGDAARKKGEASAEKQSRQYWEPGVIDYEEKVVDGFYDVICISTDSRLQVTMPSLTDLEASRGSSGFEAIVVNRTSDRALEKLIQIARSIQSQCPATKATVRGLAELVIGHMGGIVEDANIMRARWSEKSTGWRTYLQTSVLPIGSINVGLSRHRALLFKVLADSIDLPCGLVKYAQYTGEDDEAVNLIELDDKRKYLVDLMDARGMLTPLGFCSGKHEYNGEISKLPSFQSSNELKLVHSRPQPSAGKRSSQSSLMETDSYLDRKSSSKTSESFPSFPFGSHDPGLGPSRVSGGTAQQLNANVVPQSKDSSEDLTNLFADLNPFTTEVFGKAPMEGNSPGIRISEIKASSHWNPFSENSPMSGCSTGQYNTMPCEERLNAQVREDSLRSLENLQHGIADSPSGCGSHEIAFPDPRKCTNDRSMDTNFILKDSEGLSSSIDSNTNNVDVGDEIQWKHLVIGERIGIGSYGEVYHADWNGKEVAVKKFLEQDLSGAALDKFRQEVQIISGLRHPNVVLFMGAVTRPPHLSIVTEFVPGGSLYRIIHHPHCHIDEKVRIKMALDVAKGMNYLHTSFPTIVHRDLKSPNLLVDQNWNVKICDFGMSRLMHNTFLSSKSTAGTAEWMAPEVLRNELSNEKCDVFSFGVILWELATLRVPWTGMNTVQVVLAVGSENRRLEIPKEVNPLVGKIIRDCWQTEPNLRPSFAELTVALEPLQRLVIPS